MTDLAHTLAALDSLPASELPEAIGLLEAAKARAWARLTNPPATETPVLPSAAALDISEAMRRTGMSKGWLYREARAGRLPFAKRIGRRLVFDEAGLTRWLARRR